MHAGAYRTAQLAIAELKSAVYQLLAESAEPLRNVDVGRLLGIHHGHVRHQGHITRTMLELMRQEGVVVQEPNKRWRLAEQAEAPEAMDVDVDA